MIQVNKIEPFTCEAFYNEDSLGMLNEYEFNDLRIQIKNDGAEGFYMKFQGEIVEIDTDGRCKIWPEGFYDYMDKQLYKLI